MNRIHHTITGEVYKAKRKGGRNPLLAELRRNATITVHTTQSGKLKFLQEQENSDMSQSSFGELIVALGLESYLNQKTA